LPFYCAIVRAHPMARIFIHSSSFFDHHFEDFPFRAKSGCPLFANPDTSHRKSKQRRRFGEFRAYQRLTDARGEYITAFSNSKSAYEFRRHFSGRLTRPTHGVLSLPALVKLTTSKATNKCQAVVTLRSNERFSRPSALLSVNRRPQRYQRRSKNQRP